MRSAITGRKKISAPAVLVLLVLAAGAGFLVYQTFAGRNETGVAYATFYPSPKATAVCVGSETCHDDGRLVTDDDSPTGKAWECTTSRGWCWRTPKTAAEFAESIADIDSSKSTYLFHKFNATMRDVSSQPNSHSRVRVELISSRGLIYTSDCWYPDGMTLNDQPFYSYEGQQPFREGAYNDYEVPVVFDTDVFYSGRDDFENPFKQHCRPEIRDRLVDAVNLVENNFEQRIRLVSGKVRIAKSEWQKGYGLIIYRP